MTQIILENLDPGVVSKLQARAQKHGRSLQAELKVILEQAASTESLTMPAAEVGWPPGFFERTAGAWVGEPLVRGEQGQPQERDWKDL